MPDSENTPHLLIPDEDISDVPMRPAGRPERQEMCGAGHESHGDALLRGLQSVTEFFSGLRSDGIATDPDLLTFLLVAGKPGDLERLRKFIEIRGMRIHALLSSVCAVVTISRGAFDRLEASVVRYRDSGIRKAFRHVVGFAPFTAEDKMSVRLRRFLRDHPDATAADVIIMLMPNLTPEREEEYSEMVRSNTENHGGTLIGSPFTLTDGTGMFRAAIPLSAAGRILSDPAVYRADITSFFGADETDSESRFSDRGHAQAGARSGTQTESSGLLPEFLISVFTDRHQQVPELERPRGAAPALCAVPEVGPFHRHNPEHPAPFLRHAGK